MMVVSPCQSNCPPLTTWHLNKLWKNCGISCVHGKVVVPNCVKITLIITWVIIETQKISQPIKVINYIWYITSIEAHKNTFFNVHESLPANSMVVNNLVKLIVYVDL